MTKYKVSEDMAREILLKANSAPDYLPAWYIFDNSLFNARQKKLQHEATRLALDLDYILMRIVDPLEKFEVFLEDVFTDKFKNRAAELMNNISVGFELIYHLENYSFRAKAQKNKVIKFISEALKDNQKIREELKKEWKDAFKVYPLYDVVALRERVTHNIHYSGAAKLDPWFMPSSQNWPKSSKELQRIWRERMQESVMLVLDSTKCFQKLNTHISEKIIETLGHAT